jgi:hypothetical protein
MFIDIVLSRKEVVLICKHTPMVSFESTFRKNGKRIGSFGMKPKLIVVLFLKEDNYV